MVVLWHRCNWFSVFFFFKQKTAYEMRISDWSSDVCSSDLLQNSDVGLREVHSVVFAGFVFINLDRNPSSFDDYIAPVREMLENLAIGEMRHYWWKALPIPSNWKVAQEAFFEGYHVPATHPQLEPPSADFIYKPTHDAKQIGRAND